MSKIHWPEPNLPPINLLVLQQADQFYSKRESNMQVHYQQSIIRQIQQAEVDAMKAGEKIEWIELSKVEAKCLFQEMGRHRIDGKFWYEASIDHYYGKVFGIRVETPR